jgi:sigma54-dependent transcription regulator
VGFQRGLYKPARLRAFDIERQDYLVDITNGMHRAQICGFLPTEAHFIPARLSA